MSIELCEGSVDESPTVSAASAIYGVTMEERGVSKTVSMHFNNEHAIAEKPSANIAEAVTGARAAAAATLPTG